jgi:hypothetical protein
LKAERRTRKASAGNRFAAFRADLVGLEDMFDLTPWRGRGDQTSRARSDNTIRGDLQPLRLRWLTIASSGPPKVGFPILRSCLGFGDCWRTWFPARVAITPWRLRRRPSPTTALTMKRPFRGQRSMMMRPPPLWCLWTIAATGSGAVSGGWLNGLAFSREGAP